MSELPARASHKLIMQAAAFSVSLVSRLGPAVRRQAGQLKDFGSIPFRLSCLSSKSCGVSVDTVV